MRLEHEGQMVADSVEVAETLRAKIRGLMFRDEIPEGYGLVFPFDEVKRRSVHMLFVRVPIDVVWVVDGKVTNVQTLSPWTGFGWGRGDMIVELRAGSASEIRGGDILRVVESGSAD